MIAIVCFGVAALNIVAMHLAVHLKMKADWAFCFGSATAWATVVTVFTVFG